MSRIFLSHSSANNAEAIAVRDWLASQGFDDIFLDLDPNRGLKAGERWEQALNDAADRCEAVVFLISHAWIRSGWCRKEMGLAHRLNKRMFGVLIEDLGTDEVPRDLSGEWQLVRLASGRDGIQLTAVLPVTHQQETVTFSDEGLRRLKHGLESAGLNPKYFAWPPATAPHRAPYCGFKALDVDDAGIFFGRDGAIVTALDELRGLREAAPPRLFVILGASGAGKSSFMRAGLLPRLKRDDRHFLPLPVIRPERAVLFGDGGFLRALEIHCRDAGIPKTRAELRANLEHGPDTVIALLSDIVAHKTPPALDDGDIAKPPTLVIAVDQAEELFNTDGDEEARTFLDLLAKLLTAPNVDVLTVCTIRTDAYEPLQSAAGPAAPLSELKQTTFPLPPMATGAYQNVIEGPARRLTESGRPLALAPDLTTKLLTDIEGGGAKDALPLLAFTLERLYLEYGADGNLTLENYRSLGGIKGAVEAAVARAFEAADANPAIPRGPKARTKLLRRGLIPWLAGIDPDTGQPRRQVACLSEIPEEARPLIDLLVEAHLLATDKDAATDETTIEPAHEALLRQWGLLEGWLEEDFSSLATLAGVKRAATDWEANARRSAWLAHADTRLEEAERTALLPAFDGYLSAAEREYLADAREFETRRIKRERFLNRAMRVAAVVALVGMGLAGWQWREARQQSVIAQQQAAIAMAQTVQAGEQKAKAQRQAQVARAEADRAEKSEALARETTREAQITQSGLLAIAARDILPKYPQTAMLLALEAVAGTEAIADQRPYVLEAQLLLDEAFRAIPKKLVQVEQRAAVYSARFSPDGRLIATTSFDGKARVVEAATGRELARAAHGNAVEDARFSPDGRLVVTASRDGTARVLEALSGRELARVEHGGAVRDARFSPDGSWIATASRDGTARVVEAATGKELLRIKHDGHVRSAVFSPDGSRIVTASGASGSSAGAARVFDAATGKELSRVEHQGIVLSARFSPDGTRIATASKDATARVIEVATGKELLSIKHDGDVTNAVFSPDGRLVLTASEDGTARVIEVAIEKELARIKHDGYVTNADFSPDGRLVLTASYDHTARVIEVATGKTLARIAHDSHVTSARFSPDGRLVVTATFGGTARVFASATGPELARVDHGGDVGSAVFSPDGTRIVTASEDGTARVLEALSGREMARVEHGGAVRDARFSPDGSWIVTASGDGSARVVEAATGQELVRVKHGSDVVSAAFSPDGKWILTVSSDNTARVIEAATGRELARFAHLYWNKSPRFSPDSKWIVTATTDTARVIEAATGKELVRIKHDGHVESAVFSPDGGRIVTASHDNTARVVDVATGRELTRVKHGSNVLGAIFSPDGRWVATWSAYATVRVVEAATGRQLARIKHRGEVRSAVFSPDGTRIVTASKDSTARVIEVATGKELARIKHGSDVKSAVFSPDGRLLLTATNDAARIIEASSGRALARVKQGRGFRNAHLSPTGAHFVTVSDDRTVSVWRVWPSQQALVNDVIQSASRCLSPNLRKQYFLTPVPPSWCVERRLGRYGGRAWQAWLPKRKAWLAAGRPAGKEPPLP